MKQEIKLNDIQKVSPAFSVRIDIADTGKKLIFTGEGDKITSELFLSTLNRLDKRMKKSELFEEIIYEMECENEEITISLSKEQIEEILQAILLL